MRSHDYDVLLLDINMPGNEQLQFVRGLSHDGRIVPVVLLTGYPSMDSAVEAMRLGVVDYVVKPPKIPELCDRLNRAIIRGAALRVLTTAEQRVAELSDWIDSLKNALLTPPPSLVPEGDPSDDSLTERRLPSLERLDLHQLSAREREVLDDLAKGRQAQEIAANLGVSVSTVRTHIRSIFVKLKVNSQLALLAKLVSETSPSQPPK